MGQGKKVFKSDRDAYEVIIYAETGSWPTNDQDETDREFIREFPELVLKNPERCKKLFSKEEYDYLVKLAKEEQEKEENENKQCYIINNFIYGNEYLIRRMTA